MASKKGMSMPMEIIIAIVVLVVIALAVIMLTNGGLIKFGTDTTDTGESASGGLKCVAQQKEYIAKGKPANMECGACPNNACE